jgi:heme exporter protein D
MITGPEQWLFVIAAYAVVALVLVGLIVWVVLDGRRRMAELADLEARGIRRRSDTPS